MAISNYTELQTAVTNWLGRADLASRIPEFISLAEAKFNRNLRTRDMLARDSAFQITGEYVAVPSGFLEADFFQLNSSPRKELTFLPNDKQTTDYNASGIPAFYSVVGGYFRFAPIPSTTQTATLAYYKRLDALASTNWLLTAHPDIYLYASLLEAAPFLGDDARIATWATALERCAADLKRMDGRSKTGNGMMVRAG